MDRIGSTEYHQPLNRPISAHYYLGLFSIALKLSLLKLIENFTMAFEIYIPSSLTFQDYIGISQCARTLADGYDRKVRIDKLARLWNVFPHSKARTNLA